MTRKPQVALVLPEQGTCPREDLKRGIQGTNLAGGEGEGSDAALEVRGDVYLPCHPCHHAQPLVSQPF